MHDISTYDAICMTLAHLWEAIAVEKDVNDARNDLLNTFTPPRSLSGEPTPSVDTLDDARSMMAEMGRSDP